MSRALITGYPGQDAQYLAELLLLKGYEVYVLVRRSSTPRPVAVGLREIQGDMLDQPSLERALDISLPHEVYNLAAQSFVGESWNQPIYTLDVNGMGLVRLLEAVRRIVPYARVYQASSSEMFGNQVGLLNESSPLHPRSPYGVSKVFAHHAAVNYRESHEMHISCGILFNHESPRRGVEFVTRKITRAAARGEVVKLGNVDARRDWGHARDYVRAMWLMLQQDKPDDYVISTGKAHSILDILTITGCEYEVDPALFRPAEIDCLTGDATKATLKLGWEPRISFEEMIQEMVAHDRR